jgi:amidase
MSVPLHMTPEGLPVGVQIAAAPGRDDLLLQVAAQLEEAQAWVHRFPPPASRLDHLD